jgi:hypothetical protein
MPDLKEAGLQCMAALNVAVVYVLLIQNRTISNMAILQCITVYNVAVVQCMTVERRHGYTLPD